MFKKILLIATFLSSMAHAAGSITLDGTLRSFSASTVEIADKGHIYSIDKKRLAASQAAALSKLKIGDKTQLTVNFDAITSAKKLSR